MYARKLRKNFNYGIIVLRYERGKRRFVAGRPLAERCLQAGMGFWVVRRPREEAIQASQVTERWPPGGGEEVVPPGGGDEAVPPGGGDEAVPPGGGEEAVSPGGGEPVERMVPPGGGESVEREVHPGGGEEAVPTGIGGPFGGE